MKRLSLSVILMTAGCVAPSSQPAPVSAQAPPRQCFQSSLVNGYKAVDEQAVLLRVGASEVWRLNFQGSCPNIGFAFGRIGLEQRIGGQICRGYNADVVFDDRGFPRRCPVAEVRRLTQAEIAALPDGARP